MVGWLGAPGLIAFVLFIMCVASFVLLMNSEKSGALRALTALTAITAVLLEVSIPSPDRLLHFRTDLTKTIGTALDESVNHGVVDEYHKWDPVTRLDILSSPHPFSIGRMAIRPDVKLVTFDGDAISYITGLPPGFPTPDDTNKYFESSFLAPFFKPVANGNHLVIGLGGGPDVMQSLAMGARKITVVEINAAILAAMRNQYASYNGNILNRPNVQPVHSEGRNFVRSTPEKFDLIRMTGVDTFAAHTAGAYVLAENYLYTVNAFREYYRHLTDAGLMSVQRWFEPGEPRESLRLFAVVLDALRAEGVEHPEDHVIVLWRRTEHQQPPGVTLISKRPFSKSDIGNLDEQLSRTAPTEHAVPVYYPHVKPGAFLQSEIYHAYADAFSKGTELAFRDGYPYDITPVTDDKPFFFNYYKLTTMLDDWDQTGPIQGYWAYIVFGFIIICASVAVSIFIWLPLVVFRRQGLSAQGSGTLGLYFCCLGLGFITIEIIAMQKFALLLGHPMYAIATVMGGMLVFAGLGSYLSGHFMRKSDPIRILSVCTVIVAGFCLLLASPTATEVIDDLLALTLAARIAATLLILAVGAIPLGFFFPVGMSIAARSNKRFIPWAWGINSGFTVIGSVLSIAASMKLGFSIVLMLSAFVYLLGLLAINRHERIAAALVATGG